MLHVVTWLFYGPTQFVHWLLQRWYHFERSLNSTSVCRASAVCTIMSNEYKMLTSIYKIDPRLTVTEYLLVKPTLLTQNFQKYPGASVSQACNLCAKRANWDARSTLGTRLPRQFPFAQRVMLGLETTIVILFPSFWKRTIVLSSSALLVLLHFMGIGWAPFVPLKWIVAPWKSW